MRRVHLDRIVSTLWLRGRVMRWSARVTLLLWSCLLCWCPAWNWADDRAELPRYFAQLRSQGMFSVAEDYGVARLAEAPPGSAEQGILAVELSRVYSSHAAESSPTESQELWARASQVVDSIARDRSHPRWIAARMQQARLVSDQAATAFWGWRLEPESVASRPEAFDATQRALQQMATAQTDLQDYNKTSGRGNRTPEAARVARSLDGAPSSLELRQFGDELVMQRIRLHLNLAHLMETSPDRAAALRHAEEDSGELIKHVNSDFLWPARLARIEALRLSDPERAVAFAKSLLKDDLSLELVEAIRSEHARGLLAQNLPADALTLLIDHGRERGTLGPEARSVIVECLQRSWNLARDKQDQTLGNDLWKQMTDQQALISGPWRSYVDALLVRSNLTRQYGDKLAGFIRQGQAAAQAARWDQAVSAYTQAVEQATADRQLKLAADLSYTVASLQIRAGQIESAVVQLRDFSQRYPDDPRLPESHLLLTWALGQLHEQQPGAPRRADYLAELKRHLELYPDHSTSGEARWSLAVDAIRHDEWAAAVEFLESIPVDHARAAETMAQLPHAYEQVLSQLTDDHQKQSWEGRVRAQLGRQVALWPKPPAGWSLAASEAAIRWTRVLMRYRQRPYREVDQLLSQVLSSRDHALRDASRDGSQLDSAWDRLIPAATQLRIVALAGQGRMGEAETLLSGTMATPEELLAILTGLAPLADQLDARARHDLGRVQLSAARRIDAGRSTLPPEMAPVVDRCLAEAYTATGDLPEAIEIYERLLRSRPRDRALLETIADLRVRHGKPDDWLRAKSIYRQLEGFDPAGSAAWLRTRLNVARVCHQAGEHAECEKLLKVTRILYPQLGGDSLRAEYAELEAELKK